MGGCKGSFTTGVHLYGNYKLLVEATKNYLHQTLSHFGLCVGQVNIMSVWWTFQPIRPAGEYHFFRVPITATHTILPLRIFNQT